MIRKICKKATIWLLAGVISLSAVTVQAAEVDNGASYPITTNAIEGWPQGPDTYSETAVLMDADTGTILYNKGMDEKRYPASITKIMTAILAFNFGDGFCNYILPTSTALMGIISACNIPYDRWMRFMWKIFILWLIVGTVLLIGAQLIHFGPM